MLRRLALAAVTALLSSNALAELRVDAGLDWGVVSGGRHASAFDGAQSKLRYGSDDEGPQIFNGYLQVQQDLGAVWNTKLAVDINPDSDDKVGVIDAFVQYRPLPINGLRIRAKAGAFRPPVSFEHGADGWASLYTLNASAINSWVGEELGGLGAELTMKRDIATAESPWYWALSGAVFYGNDPAATTLAWRGWSMNNWQTAAGGTIDLPDLPVWSALPAQNPYAEPFLEIDDKPGYYTWAELGSAGRFRVRALYYDNRADPTAREDGQWGWCTSFLNVGVQAQLPMDVGLIAQWMDGMTYAGPEQWGNTNWVKNGFDSWFVLLTRSWARHRVSVRHEHFAVDDQDFNPIDPNDEDGTGITLSYQFRASDRWQLGIEYLRADSDREARALAGDSIRRLEHSWFATARFTL